jgi:hypothetical protein
MSKEYFNRLAKKYSDPVKVQKFLRSLDYNRELKSETLRSAFSAAKSKEAHCLEASLLAAAILEHHGFPPLVMSLESHDNLDHVVYVYKKNNKWGSIGRSRDEGLHGRKPQFRSLRDLALSYYEPYIDKTGCITGYQVANLDEMNTDWRFSRKNVWQVEKYLIEIKHVRIKFNKKRYKKIHARYLKGIFATKSAAWL